MQEILQLLEEIGDFALQEEHNFTEFRLLCDQFYLYQQELRKKIEENIGKDVKEIGAEDYFPVLTAIIRDALKSDSDEYLDKLIAATLKIDKNLSGKIPGQYENCIAVFNSLLMNIKNFKPEKSLAHQVAKIKENTTAYSKSKFADIVDYINKKLTQYKNDELDKDSFQQIIATINTRDLNSAQKTLLENITQEIIAYLDKVDEINTITKDAQEILKDIDGNYEDIKLFLRDFVASKQHITFTVDRATFLLGKYKNKEDAKLKKAVNILKKLADEKLKEVPLCIKLQETFNSLKKLYNKEIPLHKIKGLGSKHKFSEKEQELQSIKELHNHMENIAIFGSNIYFDSFKDNMALSWKTDKEDRDKKITIKLQELYFLSEYVNYYPEIDECVHELTYAILEDEPNEINDKYGKLIERLNVFGLPDSKANNKDKFHGVLAYAAITPRGIRSALSFLPFIHELSYEQRTLREKLASVSAVALLSLIKDSDTNQLEYIKEKLTNLPAPERHVIAAYSKESNFWRKTFSFLPFVAKHSAKRIQIQRLLDDTEPKKLVEGIDSTNGMLDALGDNQRTKNKQHSELSAGLSHSKVPGVILGVPKSRADTSARARNCATNPRPR